MRRNTLKSNLSQNDQNVDLTVSTSIPLLAGGSLYSNKRFFRPFNWELLSLKLIQPRQIRQCGAPPLEVRQRGKFQLFFDRPQIVLLDPTYPTRLDNR
jgi:hypothetical protein